MKAESQLAVRVLIMDLCAEYCHAVDSAEQDRIAACFSPEADYIVHQPDGLAASHSLHSRDGVASYIAPVADRRRGFMHVTTDARSWPAPDRSWAGTANFQVIDNRGRLESFGRYVDIYDVSEERAMFASRTIRYVWRRQLEER